MKHTLSLLAVVASAFALQSCVTEAPIGMIYTDVTVPVTATTGSASKVGTSQATSYLGLIATGDASIAAAKANGRISSVSSVDIARKSILGIISTYTTTVRGN